MSRLTIFLSRLIGLSMLIVGLSLGLRKQESVSTIDAITHAPDLLLILGLIALVAGLALVLRHNIWPTSNPRSAGGHATSGHGHADGEAGGDDQQRAGGTTTSRARGTLTSRAGVPDTDRRTTSASWSHTDWREPWLVGIHLSTIG